MELNHAPIFKINNYSTDFLPPVKNQHYRELLNTLGMDFACAYNSSSRKQMFSSNVSQYLIIKGATERRIQTGVEREFAKYTFSAKIRRPSTIVRKIDRYPTTGIDSILLNPESVVIFEDAETQKIDFIKLSNYFSMHNYFCFPYKFNKEAVGLLQPDTPIPAGTIFANSPAVSADGGAMTGVELNLAHISVPAVEEDGIVISESAASKLGFTMLAKRTFSFGRKTWPRNRYGKNGAYQPFPDIGQYINDDNIVAAFCKIDPNRSINTLSRRQLSRVDVRSDEVVYGAAGFGEGIEIDPQAIGRYGRVVDIRVWHNPKTTQNPLPEEMTAQLMRYHNATQGFYKRILSTYNELRRNRGARLELSPRLNNLISDAIEFSGNSDQKTYWEYRREPIDHWRVEVTIAYDVRPSYGYKITDWHGCKGVITGIWPDEDMPVNAVGRRAEVLMASRARSNRMNYGGTYEQYFNSIGDDFVHHALEALGRPQTPTQIDQAVENNPELAKYLGRKLWLFYDSIAPEMSENYFQNKVDMVGELKHVLKNKIFLFLPPETSRELAEACVETTRLFPQVYGPVQYRDAGGKLVTTEENVRVGSVYFMALEKVCNDWLANNSGKLQIFGFITPIPKHMRYRTPTNNKGVKLFSESETRLLASYTMTGTLSDRLDLYNNPISHEIVCQNVITSQNPTNINRIIDRRKHPTGGHVGLKHFKHMLYTAGIRLVYKPFRHD